MSLLVLTCLDTLCLTKSLLLLTCLDPLCLTKSLLMLASGDLTLTFTFLGFWYKSFDVNSSSETRTGLYLSQILSSLLADLDRTGWLLDTGWEVGVSVSLSLVWRVFLAKTVSDDGDWVTGVEGSGGWVTGVEGSGGWVTGVEGSGDWVTGVEGS